MSAFNWLTPDGSIYQFMRRLVLLPWLVIVLLSAQILVWMADRHPPFEMLSATVNAPRPGEILRLDARVRRDLGRDCAVEFSRYLFDRYSTRYEGAGPQLMTAQGIRDMDAGYPGGLRVNMLVPVGFPPGPARMVTLLQYRCNPLQDIMRPIEVVMTVPFEVMP